jgi:acyl dehydratase
VVEGEELAGFALHLTETKMVEQVSGSQDFYPVHHDRDFARASGHEDIFFNTGFNRAALGRFLADFVGMDGWLKTLQFSMRRMNRPGDVMRVKGRVVRKYESDDSEGLVDIELWIENDREGVTTPATATVMLPRG